MATEKISTATDRGTVLTTELNSLANGSFSASGTILDNATNRDRKAIAELNVTFPSAPTDESVVDLYMVIARDGTNYSDGGTSRDPGAERYVGSFTVQNTTSAQRLHTREFDLPPFKVAFIARNGSGQAFPTTGSTVSVSTFNRTTE